MRLTLFSRVLTGNATAKAHLLNALGVALSTVTWTGGSFVKEEYPEASPFLIALIQALGSAVVSKWFAERAYKAMGDSEKEAKQKSWEEFWASFFQDGTFQLQSDLAVALAAKKFAFEYFKDAEFTGAEFAWAISIFIMTVFVYNIIANMIKSWCGLARCCSIPDSFRDTVISIMVDSVTKGLAAFTFYGLDHPNLPPPIGWKFDYKTAGKIERLGYVGYSSLVNVLTTSSMDLIKQFGVSRIIRLTGCKPSRPSAVLVALEDVQVGEDKKEVETSKNCLSRCWARLFSTPVKKLDPRAEARRQAAREQGWDEDAKFFKEIARYI